MGLFARVSKMARRFRRDEERAARIPAENARTRGFESMEPRRMLAADLLQIGAVFTEADLGSDLQGDTFEITFAGGAPGTELTQLIVDGDQRQSGFGEGDVFFDENQGGYGADAAMPFELVSWVTADPQAQVTAHVEDGTSLLTLDLEGFRAGDRLIFSIDVDEVEDFDPAEQDLQIINDGFDPITSGVEFQGSRLSATFVADDYYDASGTAEFRNRYDDALHASNLDLPADNEGGQRDRTDGAFLSLQQTPIPVSISGFVYHDRSDDGHRDAGEEGIAAVPLDVIPVSTVVPQQTVRVWTDDTGFYSVSDLAPGRYRVVEASQPAGYFDGLDRSGFVAEDPRGIATNPGDELSEIVLRGGDDGVEFNFGELLPGSLSGQVHLSTPDGDCLPETAATRTLAGVTVHLADQSGTTVQTTVTDGQGQYRFDDLRPGIYSIREETPIGLLDGGEHLGAFGGVPRGTVVANDQFGAIVVGSGDAGVGYDFCEHEPAEISGFTYHDANNNGLFDSDEDPIAGVELHLRDDAGNQLATAETGDDGHYRFASLSAGLYSITESQPQGWIDGLDASGTIAGLPVGNAPNPGDVIEAIELRFGDRGINYNFGELAPVKLSGFVFHDRNDNGVRESGEEGLAGVSLRVTPLESVAPQSAVVVETDANGMYMTGTLVPGVYEISQPVQPDGYLDGLDRSGEVNGEPRGIVDNPGDTITQILLTSGQMGTNYNFGEVLPSTIGGQVHLSDDDGNCFGDHVTHEPLAGVTLKLQDDLGNLIAETLTDAEGRYQFHGLRPGTYTVVEETPPGLLDGGERPGTIAGTPTGAVLDNDEIAGIVLGAGASAVNYDFCEHQPASLAGHVYHDANNDGVLDADESPIGGVQLALSDATGSVIATATTDADGAYLFQDLAAGVYRLSESQPAGWNDGLDTAGTVERVVVGVAENPGDAIGEIRLRTGDEGVNYNFGELLAAGISGHVHADLNGDCIRDAGESSIAGATIELLDGDGVVVAETETDTDGRYAFESLLPGSYSVREVQPDGYFHGSQQAGSHGARQVQDDLLSVSLLSGQMLVDYDFCDVPAASLSGFVFQDGPAVVTESGELPLRLNQLRDGLRTPDDTPIGNVRLELRNGLNGEPITSEDALPGFYPAGVITVMTDADGFYEFAGIRGNRSYAVYEIHPESYVDGIDTAGSTSGIAINPGELDAVSLLIDQFVDLPQNDAIVRIPLAAGQSSTENNFSEIQTVSRPTPVPPAPRIAFVPQVPRASNPPLIATPGLQLGALPASAEIPIYGGGHEYTWHLSVVDGGMPRGEDSSEEVNVMVWRRPTLLDDVEWEPTAFQAGQWTLRHDGTAEDGTATTEAQLVAFGLPGGIPISGDFNGDGITEIGLFVNGEWFVDLNGNRRWDEEDLWALLGGEQDRPVTGDWDGDGKDDIGIFGPAWSQDERALRAEPGLPDVLNTPQERPKNPPPEPEHATNGHRLLRLRQDGPRRADVIDHVLRFGAGRDVPVAADLDGDGISTIGVFRDGEWKLDVDGDGRLSDRDQTATYGQAGDIPVVGDFDGNGVDEIGVYRDGRWHVDVNHNLEMDAHDRVFELGDSADRPVVGDWDGDGADEPGIYRKAG